MTTIAPGTAVIRNHAQFWNVADLLRGDYKQSEYGKVILPLTVIRRLDCVLEPLRDAAERPFYNTSKLHTIERVLDDATNVADQLRAYLAGFLRERQGCAGQVRVRDADRPA